MTQGGNVVLQLAMNHDMNHDELRHCMIHFLHFLLPIGFVYVPPITSRLFSHGSPIYLPSHPSLSASWWNVVKLVIQAIGIQHHIICHSIYSYVEPKMLQLGLPPNYEDETKNDEARA